MVETLKYSKIGEEDIEFGTGTFEADLSDGRRVSLTKVNLSSFVTAATANAIFYADASSVLTQDAQFLFNDVTIQQTIGTSGSLRIGSTGTADGQIHIAVDGASKLQLENTGATVADVSLVYTKEGTDAWNISLDDSNSDHLSISSGGTPTTTPHMFFSSTDGSVIIGSNTLNSFNTAGLTIDQGANDDEAGSFKSSDVAHGVTDRTETDTWLRINKQTAATGGAFIEGLGESIQAMDLSGVGTTATTVESTAATAPVTLNAFLKSGTGVTAYAAADNILVVRNNNLTRAIFKGDGDVELDGTVTSTSYDEHDDIQLLETFKAIGNPDYRQTLGAWFEGHLEILEQGRVITRYNDNGREGYFVSQRGIQGLLVDSVRQLAGRIEVLESGGTPAITSV